MSSFDPVRVNRHIASAICQRISDGLHRAPAIDNTILTLLLMVDLENGADGERKHDVLSYK